MGYPPRMHYTQRELRALQIEDNERDIQTTYEYHYKDGTWDSPEWAEHVAWLTMNLEHLRKHKDCYMLIPPNEPKKQDRFTQAPKLKPVQSWPHI